MKPKDPRRGPGRPSDRTPDARQAPDPRQYTDRLELVPVAPADLGEMHSLYTDPDVRRHLWDDLVVDHVETDNVIRASMRTFRAHQYGLYRLQHRSQQVLVGVAGLRETGTEAELVVAIHPRFQRQGYAREAGTAVLGHALRKVRLRRVIAMCDVANEAARAFVRALGMREQHVTRASGPDRTVDVVLYEITLADLPPAVVARAS